MTATDTASHKVSSWNRQTYQRLKLALSLGLRRQLFMAVCDDLSLRNRLAGKLHSELGATSAKELLNAQNHPKLVSLNLSLSDPNPLGQMAQWLVKNRASRSPAPIPGFQILGVERLTRQSPTVQRLFLRRLQAIEPNLSRLESTLLIWVPKPWFHTIQQSVPEFWQLHTGIFEFEGEPTPLPPVGASQPEASKPAPPSEEATGSFKEDLRTLLAQDLVTLGDTQPESDFKHPQSGSPSPFNLFGGAFPPVPNYGNFSSPTLGSSPAMPQEPAQNRGVPLQPDLKVGKSVPPEPTPSHEIASHDEVQVPEIKLSESATPSEPSEQQSAANPTALQADAYLQLGNYYRQAIEQGDASEENLAIAIQAYEQALQYLEQDSPHLPDILNDVGNLYWILSRSPGSTEHALSYLEQAIQSYQLALTKLVAEAVPQTYAMIQNNLGAAYGDLARHQEPVESLEQSIRAYEEALRYRPAQSEPMKYASTQNNLGTAHWNLAQHQSPVPNLRAAITAYAEALSYYRTDSEPLSWAMIQNNLGTAYWNLAQYEQPEHWLELATTAYQDALLYRKPEVAPAACAATQNNLGTAYWHLADRFQDEPEARVRYLQQCITTYESAISLVQQLAHNNPPTPVNFDVLAAHNNLGLAYYQLATDTQLALDQAAKSAQLEAALHQHVQACSGVTPQSESYQTTLSYIVKTIRAFYREGGIAGQNLALSKVPGQLLPEILPRL